MEILEENIGAYEAFLTLRRSWRLISTPKGILYQGLDLSTVAALFLEGSSRKSRKRFERLLKRLQILETAALPILNESFSGDGE